MPLVLSAHRGNDTGGTGYRISQAFKQAGPDQDWVFRSACNPSAVLTYLDYPEDVPWDQQLVRQLFAEADVFHARNDFGTYERLGGRLPLVAHYHGSNFRSLWGTRLRQQRELKALGLVSTLDLHLIAPSETEWLPSPFDVDWLQQIAEESA